MFRITRFNQGIFSREEESLHVDLENLLPLMLSSGFGPGSCVDVFTIIEDVEAISQSLQFP